MRGAWELRRRYGRERFDVVHAHFGLSAWPALAVRARVRALTVHGTDLSHPRTRRLTARVSGRMDILAAASAPLAQRLPAGRERAQVLPCGVDLVRFRSIPRARARADLKLASDEPFLLFIGAPSRPEKHYDHALALARDANVELRALYDVAPELMAQWINAANAVLVPSAREGFGLAVLEALACDVPVLATPVGIHPEALRELPARSALPSSSRPGAGRSLPTCAIPTPASPVAPTPSHSPRWAWPKECSTPGALPCSALERRRIVAQAGTGKRRGHPAAPE